jgi:hypothetical protein
MFANSARRRRLKFEARQAREIATKDVRARVAASVTVVRQRSDREQRMKARRLPATPKRRVAQLTVIRPLKEFHLGNQLRSHQVHPPSLSV